MAEYIERETMLRSIADDVAPFNVAMVFRHIHNAPAADVASVVHGRWVAECVLEGDDWVFEDVPYNPHQHCSPICSRCRKTALLDGGEDYVASPYCPNCGAKMDGKDGGDSDAAD